MRYKQKQIQDHDHKKTGIAVSIASESDPIFVASPAYHLTSANLTAVQNLGTMSSKNDAPSDSKYYCRYNGSWVEVTTGGLSDAPSDGSVYGRKDGAWTAVSAPSAASTQMVNLNSSMTTAQIQALIDAVPAYIPYGVSVTFQFADGTYTLDAPLYFRGFYGGGSIYIQGNPSDASASETKAVTLDFSGTGTNGVYALNTSVILYTRYLRIKVSSAGGYGAIRSAGCPGRIRVHYCSLMGTATTNGYGVICSATPMVDVIGCFVAGVLYGFHSAYGGFFLSENNDAPTGNKPGYGLAASRGGVIAKSGTQPSGATADEITNSGGVIR